MIPVKYNVRSLRVRWWTALSTILAIAAMVWITVLTFGMVDGINHALRVGGDAEDLIVLGNGSNTETGSNIDHEDARNIKNLPGIAKDEKGEPLCASEFVTILQKPRRGNGAVVNLIMRGVEPASPKLRPNFKILEGGRYFRSGVNEAITSEAMANRFANLRIGEKIDINKSDFTIVGYFEAGGSSCESEVWTDINDLTKVRREQGAVSIVNLRTADEQSKKALIEKLKTDKQFDLESKDEPTYFEGQSSAAIAPTIFGWVMFIFLVFGAMFAIANTMFAAVASRGREIGALRAIGFSRASVLFAFLLESVLICMIGGLIGCLATLPFNGLSTGTANWETFSELTFSFRFGPWVLIRGVFMATMMGLFGGIFPAIRAAYRPITTALRMT